MAFLVPGTQPFIHNIFRQPEEYRYDGNYVNRDRPDDPGIVVYNDVQLLDVLEDHSNTNILMAPGNYTAQNIVTGSDRTANPLTIQSLDPNNMATFRNVGQDVSESRYVTFKKVRFKKDAGVPLYLSIFDNNGQGCSNLTIDGVVFDGPQPPDLYQPEPQSDYGSDMLSGFRLDSFNTHSYTIINCIFNWIYTFGSFNLNGNVLIANNQINGWYFDGLRMLGTPDEGRVPGSKIISRLDISDNVGRYNEIVDEFGVTTNAPHPDHTQGFNRGSLGMNTNPYISDVLFHQCAFNAGFYRGNIVQAGLTQSRMINCHYVESLFSTKANWHGISIASGGDGCTIQRCSMVDTTKTVGPWVRLTRVAGQIVVRDSIFPGGFNFLPDQWENLPTMELEDTNNIKSLPDGYDGVFNEARELSGIDGLKIMFTPKVDTGQGALGTDGEFRNLPHAPFQAEQPGLTGGSGQFTVDTINTPTLQALNQVELDGDIYTRFDVSYSPSGDHDWTEIIDVSNGEVVDSLSPGDYDVRTRCVNNGGVGVWSKVAIVAVT